MTLPIHWTAHARERVAERFFCEGWRVVPARKIARDAEKHELQEIFVTRKGMVRYVCKRVECGVLTVTVYKRKKARR